MHAGLSTDATLSMNSRWKSAAGQSTRRVTPARSHVFAKRCRSHSSGSHRPNTRSVSDPARSGAINSVHKVRHEAYVIGEYELSITNGDIVSSTVPTNERAPRLSLHTTSFPRAASPGCKVNPRSPSFPLHDAERQCRPQLLNILLLKLTASDDIKAS